jgi:hypothetical protein
MTDAPGAQPLTIVLRFEVSPSVLAAITELARALRISLAPAFVAAPGAAAAFPASAVQTPAEGAPDAARSDSSLNLPAAATQAPPVLSGERQRGRPAQWKTAARAERVRALWPTGATTKDIVARVNALPGPPVPSPISHTIAAWAYVLGVKRPPGKDPFHRDRTSDAPACAPDAAEVAAANAPSDAMTPAAALDALAAPAVSVASQPDVVAPAQSSTALPPATPKAAETSDDALGARAKLTGAPATWSVERIALLRRVYPDARIATSALLQSLNRMPGAPIPESWMHNYAVSALKLSRRRDAPFAPAPTPDVPPQPRQTHHREAIEAWCNGKGWRFEKFDIDAINRRCATIGHPGFNVADPARLARTSV